ncbi:MAG: hypothetical protein LC808_20845 [Actinobacteria bacterium]|nr:hypothetical protein [Actinomycetota bacterium]
MAATSRYFSAFVRPGWGVRGPTLSGVPSQPLRQAIRVIDRHIDDYITEARMAA